MNLSGQFTTILDLGEIGEREASVSWEGYRATHPAEDDCNEMTIVDVRIARGAGPSFDITSWLTESSIDSLKDEAWEKLPTKEDIEAERADRQYREFREQREAVEP